MVYEDLTLSLDDSAELLASLVAACVLLVSVCAVIDA